MSLKKHQFLWALGAVAFLLATVFSPRPAGPGPWLRALFDWLHVPVFGLIAVALYVMTPRSWPSWQRFAGAFLGAVFLGVATEAIQIPMQRDASWEDIASDSIGAFSFLLLVFACGRRFLSASLAAVAALCFLTLSARPLIAATQAIYYRTVQFPVLFGGDINRERRFLHDRNVRLATRSTSAPVRSYLRIEATGNGGPGIEFRDLEKDWSKYRNLELDFELEGDTGLDLTIRVHDRLHRRGDQPHEDRFSQLMKLRPGVNTVSIPLEDIRNAPAGRTMDMSDIEAIIIYGRDIEPGRVVRLYEIRLD
jgi:VanZ family protein